MPLYDYRCTRCASEYDEVKRIDARKHSTCPKCGAKATLQVPRRAPGLSLFKPGWWRDLGLDPVYIDNPQELRDACDKNNCTADYLENGVWKTSPGSDPDPDSAPELFQGGSRDGGDSEVLPK